MPRFTCPAPDVLPSCRTLCGRFDMGFEPQITTILKNVRNRAGKGQPDTAKGGGGSSAADEANTGPCRDRQGPDGDPTGPETGPWKGQAADRVKDRRKDTVPGEVLCRLVESSPKQTEDPSNAAEGRRMPPKTLRFLGPTRPPDGALLGHVCSRVRTQRAAKSERRRAAAERTQSMCSSAELARSCPCGIS
jgi:hypothetical protein